MLQARYILDLLFKRGIGFEEKKNNNYFSEIENMKPTDEGFEGVDKDSYSFIETSLEEPQTFEIGNRSFLFSSSSIYEVVGTSTYLLFSGIEVGGRWSVADYQIYALFTNGKKILKLDTDGNFSYTEDIPVSKGMVNYNGQLIQGGHTLDINNFIPALAPSLSEASSFISWSGIGNLIITPDEENIDPGFRSLNEFGTVLGVGVLDNSPIVISTAGVNRLVPVEHFFGVQTISDFGPANEWNYCFSTKALYWVDSTGRLWMLSEGLKLELLGFSSLFKNKEVRMFYQKSTQELFISTPERTYILGNRGMYSLNGVLKGSSGRGVNKFIVSSVPVLTDGKFVTSVYDFKDPGLKIITEVSIGIETGEEDIPLSFRILTREKVNGPWFYSPFYRINNENVCKPHVAGCEFKIEFKAEGFDKVKPSWMIIQYTKIDKRYNRGHSFVDINKESY